MIMKIIRNSIAFFSSILLSASISISAYCQTPNHFPIEDAIQTKEAGHHKDFNPAVFKKKFEDYIPQFGISNTSFSSKKVSIKAEKEDCFLYIYC